MATFKKAVFVAAIALAFAFNACSDGSDGKNGANGSDGANGINGADGASCYVSPDPTQTHAYSVYCGNSPVGYIDNGQNGTNGADGASCYVSEDPTQAHAYLVYCGNLLVGHLNNGQNGSNGAKGDNGENGESCVASESDKPELGDIKITCGADVQYIKNGAKGDKGDKGETGESCFGIDDEDKSIIICGTDTVSIIAKFDICNNILYNRTTHFCGSDVIYDKATYDICGNAAYNRTTHFCASDAVYDKSTHGICGDNVYLLSGFDCLAGNKIIGSFVDARDSKTYQMVQIGRQIWMAENLNYDTLDGTGSKCYKDKADSSSGTDKCGIYGRLYNWSTAMGISATYISSSYTASANYRGICPTGWHIPSDVEWDTLMVAVGGASTAGTKLKSESGWSTNTGTDDYGFSALPGGDGSSYGNFFNVGNYGYWWSATEYSSTIAYYRSINSSRSDVYRILNYGKMHLFSVRCLRD